MLLRLFLLSTILISSAHPLFGQAMDGNLTGTISDPSGAALKGASLELLLGQLARSPESSAVAVSRPVTRVRGLHSGSRLNRPMGWISSPGLPAG